MKSLTEVLSEHICDVYAPLPFGLARADCSCNEWIGKPRDHAAHVAAVWRETRTVRSVEEIALLPLWTLLVPQESLCGTAYQRLTSGVDDLGSSGEGGAQSLNTVPLPALVVWLPTDEAGA